MQGDFLHLSSRENRRALFERVQQRKAGDALVVPPVVRSTALKRINAAPTDEQMGALKSALGAEQMIGRVVPFVISSGERVDDGLKIDPTGWDTAEYDRVPRVYWQHGWWRGDRNGAPLADSMIIREPDQLSALCAFYPREISNALDGGFSWAIGELAFFRGFRCSVTFDVVEARLADEETRKSIPWALDVEVARLWEWSICNLGMDWQAITAGRAAGVDTTPIADFAARLLDEGGLLDVIRAELEKARAAAAPAAPVVSLPSMASEMAAALRR